MLVPCTGDLFIYDSSWLDVHMDFCGRSDTMCNEMSIGPPYSQLQIFLLDFYWGLSKTSWGLPIYAEVSSRAIPFHCKESCCFCLPAHIAALWGKTDSVHLNYRRKCHFAWSFFGSAAEQNHTCLLSVMHLLHLSLVSKIKVSSGRFEAHKKWTWKGPEALFSFSG